MTERDRSPLRPLSRAILRKAAQVYDIGVGKPRTLIVESNKQGIEKVTAIIHNKETKNKTIITTEIEPK